MISSFAASSAARPLKPSSRSAIAAAQFLAM
jgi:hypothetical protein